MKYEHHPLDLVGKKTMEKMASVHGEFRDAPEMLEFIKKVYEIAFGNDAYNRGFYKEEVLARLRNYSDESYLSEQYRDKKLKKKGFKEWLKKK